MKIRLLRPAAIDRQKYDQCILHAPNGTLYAMSWYLDAVAPRWQLLATDDYSLVMPLPRKEKFGIPYLLQPPLCQQLGLFSPENIPETTLRRFIKKIPPLYCILQLNAGNAFNQKELRPNYILDIRPPYETLRRAYHQNTQTSLKKAAQANLLSDNQIAYPAVLALLRQHSPHYPAQLLDILQKLAAQAHATGSLYARCIRRDPASEPLAAALFFRWKNRFYYLAPVSTPAGKSAAAMRLLIDRFIAEFSGQDYLLDFEGSAIPSVAQFYRNFGAIPEYYPVYRSAAAKIFSLRPCP